MFVSLNQDLEFKWLEIAAKNGHPIAQSNLADLLLAQGDKKKYILDSAIRSKIFSRWIQYRFLLFFEGYGDYDMNNLKILGWDKNQKLCTGISKKVIFLRIKNLGIRDSNGG